MGWLFQENLGWLVVAALLGAVVTVALALVRVRTADPAQPQAPVTAEPEQPQAAANPPVVEPEPEPQPEPEPEPEPVVEPGAEPEPAVDPGPEALVDGGLPGAAEPLSDGSAPSRHFSIKGNKGSMKYHTAASPYYRRVRADWWFDSEEAAVSAGFRRWDEKDPTVDAPPAAPMPDRAPAAEATLFDTDEPAPTPEPEPEQEPVTDPAHPHGPGSAAATEGGGSPDPAYGVKGVATSRTFHTEDSPWFSRMRADVWFDSEESARAAGFERWDD